MAKPSASGIRLVLAAVAVTAFTGCGGGDTNTAFKGTRYENVPAFDAYGGYTEALSRHLRECGVEGNMDDFVANLRREGQGAREISEPSASGAFLVPARRIEVTATAGNAGSDVVYRVSCIALRPEIVATVGTEKITLAQFDRLLAQVARGYKAQGGAFPPPPDESQALRVDLAAFLVDRARNKQLAAKLGIRVTDQEVEKQLVQVKKENFGGSERKYEAELRRQGLTDEVVRESIRADLLAKKIPKGAAANVKVSYAPGFGPSERG